MTTTRKWMGGCALICALVLVGGWFLLISPQRAQVADLQGQTESQLDQNAVLETEVAILEEEYKNLPKMQAELAALRGKLPETPELASYIRQLQELSAVSGVTLDSLTPAAPLTVGGEAAVDGAALAPEQLAALNVDIIVKGSFFEITKFLNQIETTDRYTLVAGLAITDEDSESTTTTTTGDADLTATLNARIYLLPTEPELVEAVPAAEPAPSPTATPAP